MHIKATNGESVTMSSVTNTQGCHTALQVMLVSWVIFQKLHP